MKTIFDHAQVFLVYLPILSSKLFMGAACHVWACFEREVPTDFAYCSNVAAVAWISRGERCDFKIAIDVYKSMRESGDDIDWMEIKPQLENVEKVLQFKFHQNKAYDHAIFKLKTSLLKGYM